MSHSDEDDFLSADEDVEESVAKIKAPASVAGKLTSDLKEDTKDTNVIRKKSVSDEETEEKSKNLGDTKQSGQQSRETTVGGATKCNDDAQEDLDDDPDNDDEARAEYIRERNLKLARKFSAEIAKNVKAASPVPMKSSEPIDIARPKPTMETDGKLYFSPPAPPPTPALSSSLNNDEPTTQYNWRVPMKLNKPSKSVQPNDSSAKTEQARQALDRLSALASSSDKNLFEKVAEDIQKVSIKSRADAGESHADDGNIGLPTISDFGSALGGWGWNSASKLIASASQVTTQGVGSVFDTVARVSQEVKQQIMDDRSETGPTNEEAIPDSKVTSRETSDNRTSPSMIKTNVAESVSSDAIDFTLNAMESLGKKAFGVMTERNDSGSLQIKGLGRPWEHFIGGSRSATESSPGLEQPPMGEVDRADTLVRSEGYGEEPMSRKKPLAAGLKQRKKAD